MLFDYVTLIGKLSFSRFRAVCIVLYEPPADIPVSVVYSERRQIGLINLFGRSVPLFVGLLFFWYISVHRVC